MKNIIFILLIALMSGCTYYQTAPGTYYAPGSSKFDQSWSAVNGAFQDQGVRITNQNRGTGIVQGTRDGTEVIVNVDTQADGSVRVQFDTSGAAAHDRKLIERIYNSYEVRMGR